MHWNRAELRPNQCITREWKVCIENNFFFGVLFPIIHGGVDFRSVVTRAVYWFLVLSVCFVVVLKFFCAVSQKISLVSQYSPLNNLHERSILPVYRFEFCLFHKQHSIELQQSTEISPIFRIYRKMLIFSIQSRWDLFVNWQPKYYTHCVYLKQKK